MPRNFAVSYIRLSPSARLSPIIKGEDIQRPALDARRIGSAKLQTYIERGATKAFLRIQA